MINKRNNRYIIAFMAIAVLFISACEVGIPDDDQNSTVPPGGDPDIAPAVRVIGVTEDSVYTSYAKVLFYPSDSIAYISRDNGEWLAAEFGEKLETEGNYCLWVWRSEAEPGAKVVNFSVDRSGTIPAEYNTNIETGGAYIEIEVLSGPSNTGIPMYAVWAEDLAGNFLQDLFVSSYSATWVPKNHSNTAKRKESLPYWLHKAGNEVSPNVFLSDPVNNIPDDLDAVSGATVDNDCDFIIKTYVSANPSDGNQVRICYEIQQSWDDGWYFDSSGSGEVDAHNTIEEPSLIYSEVIDLENTGTYDLGGTASSKGPVGYGHCFGEDGVLNIDFYEPNPLNGNADTYIFDNAQYMTELITLEVVTPL